MGEEMIPFKTTHDQILKLGPIIKEMERMGLDSELITEATKLASKDQGIYDLLDLWRHTADYFERDQIIVDVEKSIDDYLRFA
jgi:hypothetical protein